MNGKNKIIDPIGQCCKSKPKYLVRFNGSPSEDYSILLCSDHINKEPFNKHILETKEIGETK